MAGWGSRSCRRICRAGGRIIAVASEHRVAVYIGAAGAPLEAEAEPHADGNANADIAYCTCPSRGQAQRTRCGHSGSMRWHVAPARAWPTYGRASTVAAVRRGDQGPAGCLWPRAPLPPPHQLCVVYEAQVFSGGDSRGHEPTAAGQAAREERLHPC